MADPPEEEEKKVRALDEDDIALLKSYGQGPYSSRIRDVEKDVKDIVKKVNEVSGIKESDTGLAPPSRWDLVSDKQAMQEEQPLQVTWGCSMPLECQSNLTSLLHRPLARPFSHWTPNVLAPQVARCTKIIKPGTEEAKYVINVKQIAKVSADLACNSFKACCASNCMVTALALRQC